MYSICRPKSSGITHESLKIALVRYAVQILPVLWIVGFRGSTVTPSVSESTPQGSSDDSHAGWFTHDPSALLHANTLSRDLPAPAPHFDLTACRKMEDAPTTLTHARHAVCMTGRRDRD